MSILKKLSSAMTLWNAHSESSWSLGKKADDLIRAKGVDDPAEKGERQWSGGGVTIKRSADGYATKVNYNSHQVLDTYWDVPSECPGAGTAWARADPSLEWRLALTREHKILKIDEKIGLALSQLRFSGLGPFN